MARSSSSSVRGSAVDHAQRAHDLAAGQLQRGAGVEADVGRAGDERVVVEALVEQGVLHDEDLAGLHDGVAAERRFAVGLADVQADARLEPLAPGVDQAHQHDGHVELLGGEARHAVEALLGRGVEDQHLAQGVQPALVVGGDGGG